MSKQSSQVLVVFSSEKYETIDLSLKLNIITTENMNVNNNVNKRMRWTCDQEQVYIAGVKKLKKFGFYTMEEEAEEKLNGVCTKLKLYDDPWKIKKVLEYSDVNNSSRLMISRRLMQQHIVEVWKRAGRDGDVTSLEGGRDVRVKVWDCNRGKEYELILKKHPSTECYVFCGNWTRQFVKQRKLKKGDEIGLFWCNLSGRFFFSVFALAPNQPVYNLEGC